MWTDRELETLRAMWLDGKSGGEIAKALGKTRSAVLGKLLRIGLMGRGRVGKPPCHLKPNKPRKPRVVRAAASEAKRQPRVVEPPAVLMPSLNLTIFDLTRIDCRAITSPDRAAVTLYCGHTVRPGSAYCPAHHARFHTGATNDTQKTKRMAADHARAAAARATEGAAGIHAGRAAKPRG